MSIIKKLKTVANIKKIVDTSRMIYMNSCFKCRLKIQNQKVKKLKDHCPTCRENLEPLYKKLLDLMNQNKPKLKVAK